MHARTTLIAVLLLSLVMPGTAAMTTAQSRDDSLAAQVDAHFAPWDKPETPGAGEIERARGR